MHSLKELGNQHTRLGVHGSTELAEIRVDPFKVPAALVKEAKQMPISSSH